MKKALTSLPGVLLATGIALLAVLIESQLPGHYIGSAVLAMFIGIAIRAVYYNETLFQEGIKFTSKKVLKFAIILLGASLNFSIILQVGSRTVFVLIFTLLTAFGGGFILGKLFKVNWKLSNMIAAGTAICGGSAIAAMAPVIEAEDGDVSYAISATFVFDMLMVIAYPIVGRLLFLSDQFFGYWSGTSINDTSSVVAASFAFSERAGEIATMVKLTRTLAIIPTVIIFSIIYYNKQLKEPNRRKEKVSVKGLVPWFIILFVLMAGLNTAGLFPADFSESLRSVSRFLMVVALAAIGLKTDIKLFVKTGWKPFVHAMVLSSLVVVVSFAVVALIIG
ncbi:YeiH family protein [Alkalibacterium olivapovliticus]|uniref:Putative integral membrane protein (TIGR00698 family) n=1 Tax=Alkalibacterium olivapovliticus TaxID=99907 RepID=A0A2T0W7Y2_9LACT|nr:YeiH family protein [Alkalibacterium olivapovliticus]PRY82827.1 putative integral membrane protein (TIGR00698 family) [Alkalibacterium olivapovliticus]